MGVLLLTHLKELNSADVRPIIFDWNRPMSEDDFAFEQHIREIENDPDFNVFTEHPVWVWDPSERLLNGIFDKKDYRKLSFWVVNEWVYRDVKTDPLFYRDISRILGPLLSSGRDVDKNLRIGLGLL